MAFIAFPASAARADGVRNAQWHLRFLKVAEAQATTRGDGVVVGVVDTGVSPHSDLRNNLLKGTDITSGGTGDGRSDSEGHGTEMAGLIAAHGKTATDGAIGIAPDAKILPVKVSKNGDSDGSGPIAEGISWAAANGAKVINVSLASSPSLDLNDAIDRAFAADAVVVAGTGNRPRNVTLGYPAAIPGVLAVGAVDRSGKRAAVSVTGPAVQICAPGVDITSTGSKDKYSTFDGTSPATAIVSGAAALVRAKYPTLSARLVIERLTSTATDIGKPGRDDECGFGLLNIVKALTGDVTVGGETSATAPENPSTEATPTSEDDPAAGPDPGDSGVSVATVLGRIVGVLAFLGVGALVVLLFLKRRQRT